MSCDCKEEQTLEYIKGDTFYRQVVVETAEGTPVEVSFISKVEFLLLDINKTVEVTEELEYDTDIQKWIVTAPTDTWKEGTHIYRYRITYTDGNVATKQKGNIQITK